MYENILSTPNYRSDYSIIVKHQIYEYDIARANVNILYQYGKIDKAIRERLLNLPRLERQIEMGKFIKFNNLQDTLKKGILEYKKKFLTINNISVDNILEIRNDAIFIIDQIPKVTNIDNITFVNKSKYNSFIDLDSVAIYYGKSMIGSTYDFRGLNDLSIAYHKKYMIKSIIQLLDLLNNNKVHQAISMINKLMKSYMNRELPIGYYREFNRVSQYSMISEFSRYQISEVDESYKNQIDVSYNYKILRLIYNMLVGMYME